MKNVFLFICLFAFSNSFAQSDDEVAVKRAVDFFYDGINERDAYKMKLPFSENVSYQNVSSVEGKKFIGKADLNKLIEEIAAIEDKAKTKLEVLTLKINVNGFIANAWVSYKFYQFGALHQCGSNALQLTKEDGEWKIVSMLDDHSREACLTM